MSGLRCQVASCYSQSPAVIRQLLEETGELTIAVTLAGEPATLRFVEMHLLDLRSALSQVAAA